MYLVASAHGLRIMDGYCENVFSPIATWFSEAFQKAYDGVQNIWEGLGEFFKGIARNALTPIETLVNGIIKGINWVLDQK